MNILSSLLGRIEAFRATNKTPCKNYATEEAAEKATAAMAKAAADYFDNGGDAARPARYVVFFVPGWNRWVGAIDLTELLARKTSTGGYLGFCKGFYTF